MRITREDTFPERSCVERLEALISEKPGICLHASLPCTVWSTWQRVNLSRLGHTFQHRLSVRRKQAVKMLRSFISLGEKVLSLGVHVSFEWPRHCSGWARRELMEFISKNSLFVADVDGCAVGMHNSHGQPLLKQWRFVCSNDRLATSLSHLRCRHDPDHTHGKICGSETQATEIYPVSLCRTFLIGLYPDRHSVPAMPCVLAAAPHAHREHEVYLPDFAVSHTGSLPGPECHTAESIPLAVTKLLERSEVYSHPGALDAVKLEGQELLKAGT